MRVSVLQRASQRCRPVRALMSASGSASSRPMSAEQTCCAICSARWTVRQRRRARLRRCRAPLRAPPAAPRATAGPHHVVDGPAHEDDALLQQIAHQVHTLKAARSAGVCASAGTAHAAARRGYGPARCLAARGRRCSAWQARLLALLDHRCHNGHRFDRPDRPLRPGGAATRRAAQAARQLPRGRRGVRRRRRGSPEPHAGSRAALAAAPRHAAAAAGPQRRHERRPERAFRQRCHVTFAALLARWRTRLQPPRTSATPSSTRRRWPPLLSISMMTRKRACSTKSSWVRARHRSAAQPQRAYTPRSSTVLSSRP